MPTGLRKGPNRLLFYAGDGGEPDHVHVERDAGFLHFGAVVALTWSYALEAP